MARISDKTICLANGSPAIVRAAGPADARTTRELTIAVLAEAEFMIQTPDEYQVSLGQQKTWLRQMERDPDQIALLVEAPDGSVLGQLDSIVEPRRRLAHVTRFGLMVHPDWRRLGIARALIARFIDWATDHPRLEKIELHVHAPNQVARDLYLSLGFIEEGRRRKAIRMAPDDYVDDILMGLWLPKQRSLSA